MAMDKSTLSAATGKRGPALAPRIMIVDDEQYMCDICSKALSRAGYDVTAMTDPIKALRQLHESPFDILITDIQMPEVSGIELAEQARQVDPAIVIIVMTGHASMENLKEAVRRGIADILNKPFELEQLRLAVDQALHKRSLLQENLRLRAMLQLLGSSEAINASLDLAELSRRIIQSALRESACSAGALLLADGKQEFGIVQYGGQGQEVLPAGIELARRVCAEETLQVCHGSEPLLRDSARSYSEGLSLPLRAQGEIVGALLLCAETIDTQPSSYEALGILVNQAGSAIRNAQQHSELQETYERLQEFDHMKSEFIAIASHELRTPLSIVLGYTMMVRDQLEGEPRQYLQRVFENAQRIKAIVDDMIALRYLDSGQTQLELESCELNELLGEVVTQMRTAAAEKQQDLRVSLPPTPTTSLLDRDKVQLVVGHLLSNAIKFTPRDGWVELRVTILERAPLEMSPPAELEVVRNAGGESARWILIEVQDNGVGIPPKDQGRIFDRFYQVADSLTRDHGGTGLGLAVVKELVTLMGGQLGITSSPGTGSVFRLTLPCRVH
jgi:signal transduction histidine kinase/CheY-like chemotaxis protein